MKIHLPQSAAAKETRMILLVMFCVFGLAGCLVGIGIALQSKQYWVAGLLSLPLVVSALIGIIKAVYIGFFKH